MAQGRKDGVMHGGDGCPLHPTCLTCPATDCVWPIGISLKRQAAIIRLWTPYFEEKRKEQRLLMGVLS